MNIVLYTIFLKVYSVAIFIASISNEKAKLWIKGRKKIFEKLSHTFSSETAPIIWVHCASLGEFEQGRTVIEQLKKELIKPKVLLTFFSPSGYEIRKDYKEADWVFYLPMDSFLNASQFLKIVNPAIAIFVKYEYWFYYLDQCKKRNISLLLISGIFRPSHPFFQLYGGFHRKMLRCFTHFFVQDEQSKKLLQSININNCTIAGDTRFDRVSSIADNFKQIDFIEKFISNNPILIAGSTWPKDDKIIREAVADLHQKIKVILVPHEIHPQRINELKQFFPTALCYSQLTNSTFPTDSNFLIIDNIGMLTSLYHYATIAYVGGGFNNGIHNTLEAAVHGKPVLFGMKYEKFNEAKDLIKNGSSFCVADSNSLRLQIEKLLTNNSKYQNCCKNAKEYVRSKVGATEKIVDYIQENRLLTNSSN